MPVFAGSRIPRAAALAEIAHTAELVRGTMNSDPRTMRLYLDEGLMDSAGDDPRAIALCREVIEKSTNPASIAIATGLLSRSYQLLGFGPDRGRWHLFSSPNRVEEIAGIIREAWQNPDTNVKSAAAGALSGIGGSYRAEGYHDFQELLRGGVDKPQIYRAMLTYYPSDSDVLRFYDERISSSTSISDSLKALQEVSRIAIQNQGWFSTPDEKLVAIFKHGLSHHAAVIQLASAISLSRMGRKYLHQARTFLDKRLREPLGEDSDNTARRLVGQIILTLLDPGRPEDISLVKEAVKVNPGIFGVLEAGVENTWIPNRPGDREILNKWKAVLAR
jgi:hypothetical protein